MKTELKKHVYHRGSSMKPLVYYKPEEVIQVIEELERELGSREIAACFYKLRWDLAETKASNHKIALDFSQSRNRRLVAASESKVAEYKGISWILGIAHFTLYVSILIISVTS
jgi:hypothetical protein